jgi:parvulin-like peptidyl-prolyl isomerase
MVKWFTAKDNFLKKHGASGKNRHIIPIVFFIMPCAAIAGLSYPGTDEKDDMEAVATVNGEAITIKELKYNMQRKKPEAYAYFKEKYKIDETTNNMHKFWKSKYGEESPADKLKKEALDESIKIKLTQILERKKDTNEDISCFGFLKLLNKENKRRQDALKNNEPAYGPRHYTEETYYNMLISATRIKLREKIARGNPIQEEELKKIYSEDFKKGKYAYQNTLKLKKIHVPFLATDKEKALLKIKDIKNKLDGGKDFDDVGLSYSKDAASGVKFEEQEIDGKNKPKSMSLMQIARESGKLSQGQVSGIVETNDSYIIIKCVNIIQGHAMPFDKAKENIKAEMINKKLNELLNSMFEKASIEVNKNIYDKICVE